MSKIEKVPFTYDYKYLTKTIIDITKDKNAEIYKLGVQGFLENCLKVGWYLYQQGGHKKSISTAIETIITVPNKQIFIRDYYPETRIECMDESDAFIQRALKKLKYNIFHTCKANKDIERPIGLKDSLVEHPLPIIDYYDYPLLINVPILKEFVQYKLEYPDD